MDVKKTDEKLLTPSTLRTELTKAVSAHKAVSDLRKSVMSLALAEEADVAREAVDVSALMKQFTPKQQAAIRKNAYALGLRKALTVIATKDEALEAVEQDLRRQSRIVPHYGSKKTDNNGAR